MGRQVRRQTIVDCKCEACGVTAQLLIEGTDAAGALPEGWRWLSLTEETEETFWNLLCAACSAKVRAICPSVEPRGGAA